METIADQLIRHEGMKMKMYKDSLGIPTIGVGHNLQDVPISKTAVMQILNDDIKIVTDALFQTYPWMLTLDEPRKNVMINMCFNMGLTRFTTFKNMINLVQSKNYNGAADAMLASKWATQVGKRATELADIMKKGVS